jgi:ABC-type multidrug transport system ATPase subunit
VFFFLLLLWQEMKAHGVTDDKLNLLRDITGAFRPGVLTALVGVSGAGKTTLMDVLAGRKTGGYVEGSIFISGFPKRQETFARISGYCEQVDIHSPNVTVYESLLYSAWLRLAKDVNVKVRKVSNTLARNPRYESRAPKKKNHTESFYILGYLLELIIKI